MKAGKKILPFAAIATVVMIVAAATAMYMLGTTDQVEQSQIQEEIILQKVRSYVVTELDDVNALANLTIQGTIVNKYTILESRDEFGVLVDSQSSETAVSTPYLIYEIRPSETFKGERASMVSVKVDGGTVGNLTVKSDHEELDAGQEVVFLLDGPLDNGLYQLVAGPHSSFKIQNGNAIGEGEKMPLMELQNRLR